MNIRKKPSSSGSSTTQASSFPAVGIARSKKKVGSWAQKQQFNAWFEDPLNHWQMIHTDVDYSGWFVSFDDRRMVQNWEKTHGLVNDHTWQTDVFPWVWNLGPSPLEKDIMLSFCLHEEDPTDLWQNQSMPHPVIQLDLYRMCQNGQ